jgi:soluble lytic murein transglycosylase
VRRDAWLRARAERRSARWTGSLADMARARRREASLESLYLASVDPRAKRDARVQAPTAAAWRDAALDAFDDGLDSLGHGILAGPARGDEALLALRARAALSRGAPDSGLAILAWPPNGGPASRRIAAPHRLDLPALFVAGALADSAGKPAAARAAYWTILRSDPSPAARRTARLRLGALLLANQEPRLAVAVVHPEEEASSEAALLAASARAAMGDTAVAASRLAVFAATRGLPTADRYAAAMRAVAWSRGPLADSMEERVWIGLLRALDYVGEPSAGLALMAARRAPPRDSAAALERADVQASLLAKARRNGDAAAAFARLLARRDRPAPDRARWALGLARARRSLGAFGPMDSAFVAAAALDSAGPSGESAAWERAREWENRRTGREAAPVFAWAVPRIKTAALAEAARIHEAVNWMRAGAPDTARVALERLGPSSAMGRFWTGRLALARGDSAAAQAAFADAWRLGPWTYEGLRGAEELRAAGRWPADSIPFRIAAPSRRLLAPTIGEDAPLRARIWSALGYASLGREALLECARAEKNGIGPCAAALEEGGFFRAVAAPGDSADLRMEYPPAYPLEVFASSSAESLDAGIVWAIMRQETGYLSGARSRAGALGLLQLLPRTATALAGRPISADSLLDPALNVRLGARYLEKLDREMGDPRGTFAAYNAGEDAVRRWIAEQGSIDDRWVELIPYRETRDYVKQVYAAWRRYEALYGTAMR